MHIHLFDQFQSGSSFLHRLDARVKIVVGLVTILAVTLTPTAAYPAFVLHGCWIMFLMIAARIQVRPVLKRSLIALPFALAAITLIFTVPGEVIWNLPLTHWAISQEGLARFLSVVVRSWLSVLIAILLSTTTQPTDLLWAFHALKMPSMLLGIISFMIRYVFVLSDEGTRMHRARESRSASPMDGKKPKSLLLWRFKVTGWMVGQLFLRSYSRSDRVYQAMASRGYRGELRRLGTPKLETRNLILGAAVVLVAVIISWSA
ncbi:MAG: cobalt ECF transporter T component CbiQ [Chloroflexota bacterium]